MKILPDMEIADLALHSDSALIIADVHIGYEEALNKQGILVPRLQFGDIRKRMERVFTLLKGNSPKTIIVNGDLKHEFGAISEQEWRNTLRFIDLLAAHSNKIILIKGNHDNILGPIASKRNVNVVDYCYLRQKGGKTRILVTHGHRIPDKELLKGVSTIIIGHEHPAVSLKEHSRVERFKCFLKGRYKGKTLIVQPSFNSMVEGTDVLRDELLSPFLKQNLDNFEVFVVEDKIYRFGKLKNLHQQKV